MPKAVGGEPGVGLHQRSPIGMAIEVLPEGVPAGFEVLGVDDPNRQLDQPAAALSLNVSKGTWILAVLACRPKDSFTAMEDAIA